MRINYRIIIKKTYIISPLRKRSLNSQIISSRETQIDRRGNNRNSREMFSYHSRGAIGGPVIDYNDRRPGKNKIPERIQAGNAVLLPVPGDDDDGNFWFQLSSIPLEKVFFSFLCSKN